MRDGQQFGDYGLVGRPPAVDFGRLLARTRETIERLHQKKQLAAHLQQAGVTLLTNTGGATFVDEHTVALADGSELQGRSIIICAGGQARRFPFPGSEHALTHHDVWTMRALPRSMAIVGGAATGCQLASIFAAFGTEVTLFETNSHILGREDALLSQVMDDAFRQAGIRIVSGIGGLEGIETAAEGLVLRYTQQEQSRALQVEAILLAVGWVGNVSTLNLEAAGVRHERGYITVNDYLQTSVPHIFAAGDITGRMMLVQSGSYNGRVAAENAVMGVGQPHHHLIVPHGGFTDPVYGSVGLTEAEARAQEACVVAVVPYAHLDRAVIDGRTSGVCKLIVSSETHRILGAHIVGEQALEAIQLVAAGMSADMWVEHLAELELAYPTYTAIVGLAARQAVRQLGVLPLSPQWRTLGQPLAAEWEWGDA
jgi:dihydrolipoamide dehydrogenase